MCGGGIPGQITGHVERRSFLLELDYPGIRGVTQKREYRGNASTLPRQSHQL